MAAIQGVLDGVIAINNKAAEQEKNKESVAVNSKKKRKPRQKPEPKKEVKPEPKREVKPEPKEEVKPEPKKEAKSKPKKEVKPEPKEEVKPEPKKEAKPKPKKEVQTEQEPGISKKVESKEKEQQLNLNECYVQGMDLYMLFEYDQAFPLLKYVCDHISPKEKKYADAQNALGWMYEEGKGVEENLDMALRYYLFSAENGNVNSKYGYIRMVQRREETEEERMQAVRYIGQLESIKVIVEDEYREGLELYKKRKFKKAFESLLIAAEGGYMEAQYGVATMYQAGQGTAVDDAEALKWFLKAAAQGHAESQFECGCMYEIGKGTQRDESEALRWFLRAAKRGHVESAYLCSVLYMDEATPQSDPEKGMYWLKIAAEHGSKNAKRKLENL
ncbi:hypothetical protein ACQRBN_08650 [Bariatricus sp. SGI.154]|uniref:hypothetical protein n=1 Tax=Bariatricus sp. SGI.154 TaxID=3420549 RepID=UPI003CFE0D0D